MSFISDKINLGGLAYINELPLPLYSDRINLNVVLSHYCSQNPFFYSSIDIAETKAIPETGMSTTPSSEGGYSIINDGIEPAEVDKSIDKTAFSDSWQTVYVLKEVKNKIAETNIISTDNANTVPHKHCTITGGRWTTTYNYFVALFPTILITKVGDPQLSAIFELSSALKEKNIPIIADGCTRCFDNVTIIMLSGKGSIRAIYFFAPKINNNA